MFLSKCFSFFESFKYVDEKKVQKIKNTTENNLNFDKYLSNDELFQFIEDFNGKYIELTRVYEIGNSTIKHQPLKVLAISNSINASRSLLKPSIKLIANQYGNEALGRQLLVYLVQFLLENYPKNGLIKRLIDTIEIHVLFSMNPDEFDLAREGDCKSHKNASFGKLF